MKQIDGVLYANIILNLQIYKCNFIKFIYSIISVRAVGCDTEWAYVMGVSYTSIADSHSLVPV